MKKRIALFGGSFNPPGIHHRLMAQALIPHFDAIVIVPCGPRPDKPTTNEIEPHHRATMVDINFAGLSKVRVELFDLENATFTRTHALQEMFEQEGEIWHVIGTDLIQGGATQQSFIEKQWFYGDTIWTAFNFVVFTRLDTPYDEKDLPPKSMVVKTNIGGASTVIREAIFSHRPFDHLLTPQVLAYIERHNLYRSRSVMTVPKIRLVEAHPFFVFDETNNKARDIVSGFCNPTAIGRPDLVIVVGGDGTMLRAIRSNWRLRLPFFGLNAGHRGFLLNDVGSEKPSLKDILDQELDLYLSHLLHVEVTDLCGKKKSMLAHNDAWVQAVPGTTAWLQMAMNGKIVEEKIMGDGLLVASAAGSTAYARAMGATPIPPFTPALVIAGSNVLEPIGWQSACVPLDSEIEIRTLDPTPPPKKRPILGFADNIPLGEITSMRVRVSRSAAVELLSHPTKGFSRKFAMVQFPR